MQISSKLPNTGTTIFSVMSALANEHKAVNLGQGFPDYPMNEALVAKVNEAMQAGFNQYAPMQGHLPLREVLAEKVQYLYGTTINPDTQITITPGGTYGIYTSLTTVLQPGDEVIIFEPAYDSYVPNVLVNGAVPVLIELQFPEYKIDWEEVRRRITSRTKFIMLNTPHNPTGSVLSENDIVQLRSIVEGTNIFILSDEVYEHLIYDNIPHQSILRYPDLLERSFVTFSFGKLYHCTGWKMGYCISSPALMQEFRKVHQYNCFSCHTPSQVALAGFLKDKDSYLQLSSFMQAKRDHFRQLMSNTRFSPMPSYGSYFQCYQYNRISEEGDADFAVRITKEFGVATVPVSAFYQSGRDHKVIRFCFAKKEETLEMAVERLIKV
ncbi:aminotransferase class I/II-fold pyridoxal phosphate-dependent enzyme [Chitinophaga sp. SYP-B3965]|uniref:methionine aminotransferase n=1 Tax=Chitinophaga sp. SYP-B3965 TaxID=2663120 RepID=UPI001299FF7F|nr:methionine aminotransferase [Chitinophaga sp. SYP-B3965]MRG48575.1 aminotransferase class I/II-fold pyridoxal phosphate-dependent enzyme [Chitinophaga sp. SYP-B3965]